LHSSKNIIRIAKSRRMRRDGVSVGKSEGNKPLRSPLGRWKNNIKIDLRKIE
jgi:hypothetical protein